MSLTSARRAIKISTTDTVVNPTDMYKIASMVMPTSIIHPNGTGEAALAMTIMAATRARIAQVLSGPELWASGAGWQHFAGNHHKEMSNVRIMFLFVLG